MPSRPPSPASVFAVTLCNRADIHAFAAFSNRADRSPSMAWRDRRDFDRRGPPPGPDFREFDRRGPPPDYRGFDERRLGPPQPGYDRRGPPPGPLGPPLDMGLGPAGPAPAVRSGVVAVQKEPAIDREKVGGLRDRRRAWMYSSVRAASCRIIPTGAPSATPVWAAARRVCLV